MCECYESKAKDRMKRLKLKKKQPHQQNYPQKPPRQLRNLEIAKLMYKQKWESHVYATNIVKKKKTQMPYEQREKEKRKTEKSGTESLISTALCHAKLSLHHNATITRLYPESEIKIEIGVGIEI